MKLKPTLLFFLLGIISVYSQTKVSGHVYDENGEPIAYANVLFKGTTEGTITNEDGRFYLESANTQQVLVLSF